MRLEQLLTNIVCSAPPGVISHVHNKHLEMTMSETLTEDRKMAIFAELVATQDQGVPVRESRCRVGQKHGLDVADVRRIEREGLDNEWPPL